MIVEFEEVYEVKGATTGLPIEKHRNTKKFASRKIYINPEFVVCVRSDPKILHMLRESESNVGADKFTRIYMHRGQSGIDVVVAGDADLVEQRLKGERELLKG